MGLIKLRVDGLICCVISGNLSKAVDLFEKAIPLANTELEMGHLFGLRDAAIAQTTVSTRLGMVLPGMG